MSVSVVVIVLGILCTFFALGLVGALWLAGRDRNLLYGLVKDAHDRLMSPDYETYVRDRHARNVTKLKALQVAEAREVRRQID